jgi:prolyl oligopeptidase
MHRNVPLVASAVLVLAGSLAFGRAHAATIAEPPDPYLWLEDVSSARATAWVKAENAKSLGVLEKDPNYASLYADALRISQAKDRVPSPSTVGGEIYNFWQDSDHVRGIWRKTTFADYATPNPTWTTVLDVDALAASEHANWVWEGADCRRPAEDRCLIRLSDGGEDAVTVREFDTKRMAFVADGFSLPSGKQDVAWESADTLLVSRAWKPGELTASGYPFVVKRLRRGQPLDAAVEVYRGERSDVSVSPTALDDGAGHHAMLVDRGLSFFENTYAIVTPTALVPLGVPKKADIESFVAGRLLVKLDETYPSGALVSLDLAAAAADPAHLAATLVVAPSARESIEQVSATKSDAIVTSYRNVRGRATVYTPVAAGGWTSHDLALPDDSSVSVLDTNLDDDRAFLGVTGYLEPQAIDLVDASTATVTTEKTAPARFDASNDVVEQFEATSKDGTRVPYFIVHPKGMTANGRHPTILYGYGGFQVSLTPAYSGLTGKLWLERGGVYVVANIRGGGEFGPAWHDAALKTHRQRAYDDFAAVARDLIARKITDPRHLGIQGGSNGGLLMGVEFTQHPELWHAVDIQVPLLDMLRFEKIAAGSSWVGEYGTVSKPDERAFLASISPYANLRAGVHYPEPFIWTTTKDDRVGPQHARKFAAKLAALGDPYLFYEVTEGGHGSGANLKERAHTTALEMTYFIRKLMD